MFLGFYGSVSGSSICLVWVSIELMEQGVLWGGELPKQIMIPLHLGMTVGRCQLNGNFGCILVVLAVQLDMISVYDLRTVVCIADSVAATVATLCAMSEF